MCVHRTLNGTCQLILNVCAYKQVGYALDVPWYASLPRLETSFFLDQYGGEDDVWIGKTLYRYIWMYTPIISINE